MPLDQVTAVLNGKRVLAPPKDITEVRSAFAIYERLELVGEKSPAIEVVRRAVESFLKKLVGKSMVR